MLRYSLGVLNNRGSQGFFERRLLSLRSLRDRGRKMSTFRIKDQEKGLDVEVKLCEGLTKEELLGFSAFQVCFFIYSQVPEFKS